MVQYSVDTATGNSAYPLGIEFFEADSGAIAEGKTLLGADSYPTGSAQSTRSVTLRDAGELGVSSGDVIVATATDAENNTSEFSQGVAVAAAPTPIPAPTATPSPA